MKNKPLRPHFVLLALAGLSVSSEDTASGQGKAGSAPAQHVGLLVNDQRACRGYTLIAPLTAKETYLIDMEGRMVQSWHSDCQPALSACLLENGNLLRAGALFSGEQPFGGPGAGGRIQQFTWEGELVWDFRFATDYQLPHHDITPLPNGNVLLVAWDKKTADEAIAAGRRQESISNGQVLSDCILEVKPTGKTTGEIVWKWHVWDHLIQDHDPHKANYGEVYAHPELIDVNVTEKMFGHHLVRQHDEDRLRAIGIVAGPDHGLGGAPAGVPDHTRDWTHVNSVAYNADLDQIVLSVRAFSEIWMIDHSTTTAEAASHTGGRYGKGGDLLFRWGNPLAHRAGTKADQRLFKQHHAHWIPKGLPGAGRILLFNNGNNRPGGPYSTADEIAPSVSADGQYKLTRSRTFEPDEAAWSYAAPTKTDFFSMVVGGVQRLPNGNTLISSGASGTLLEVTAQKDQVWKYVNPVKGSFLGHRPPSGGPRGLGRGGLPSLNNAVFRAHRYAPNFPGFQGKALHPGKLLEKVASDTSREPAEVVK